MSGADKGARFIAQLLAPLPEGAEPVESKRFSREIKEDLLRAWDEAHHYFYARKFAFNAAGHMRLYALRQNDPEAMCEADDEFEHTEAAYIVAVDRLMLTPAPTIGAVRKKEEYREFRGGRPQWNAAIAADMARLGVSA